jgi:hypothetical protein
MTSAPVVEIETGLSAFDLILSMRSPEPCVYFQCIEVMPVRLAIPSFRSSFSRTPTGDFPAIVLMAGSDRPRTSRPLWRGAPARCICSRSLSPPYVLLIVEGHSVSGFP